MRYPYWETAYRNSRSSIISDYHRFMDEDFYNHFHEDLMLWQAKALVQIERFVERAISTTSPAYVISGQGKGNFVPIETENGRRLRKAILHLGMFDSSHDYTEHPLAFLDACWMMSSIYGVNLMSLPAIDAPVSVREAEVLNDILERIRMSAREGWFLRGIGDRRQEAEYRASVMARYTSDVLRYYARTLIVRVDMGYRKEARAFLTIDQVYDHLDRLRYLKDWHHAFYGLVGYAWVVEQGKRDGFHLHLVFYFDGSKVCWDVQKGFELGYLWQGEITNGMGTFENCNAHKDRYGEKLGIGMIHRSSAQECENAIRCLQYLGKGGPFLGIDDQYLRMKPEGRRIFGTGSAPDIEQKRGRPAYVSAV